MLEEIGDRKTLATVYGNIGAIYIALNEYDVALEHLNRAYHLFKKIGLQKELKTVTQSIMEVEAAQNRPAGLPGAKKFLNAGIEKLKKVFFGPTDIYK